VLTEPAYRGNLALPSQNSRVPLFLPSAIGRLVALVSLLVGVAFVRYAVALCEPLSEINLLAALAAERHVLGLRS